MKYPLLGDVIADDDGNFYVVWGKNGTAYTEHTVFISKYSPNGEHIKTTGFAGESPMGESGNTMTPFAYGNCVSVIADGVLMVNYARTMYNGHQSSNVVAVHIADMSPYQFDKLFYVKVPYVSHSFNQSVIYSEKARDFIFANHGDAYGRGFIIEKLRQEHSEINIFHFYLPPNANYDMWIVNKTFAQLGGLVETSRGVALVGASAKSIGEAAETEKQNLFVQIFDPLYTSLSPSMFVGGTERSGATSFDIYDYQNSPLTEVTDYGVIWLTDHTDKHVIAPQVAVADDRIVILWSEDGQEGSESYYMVLSAAGEVLTPATSLGRLKLNSYEMPVVHDGRIYWAYATHNGKIRVADLEI